MIFWGLILFLISLFIFMFCKNLMLLWLLLFINTIASLFFIFNEENQNLIKYFLIQELGSISIIFSVFNLNLFLIFGILLKVGCYPFHQWIINLIFSMEKMGLIWIWSISKIIPSFIFVSFMDKINVFYIFIFMLLNQLIIMSNNNFKLLMFFSSLTNFFWMIFLSMIYLFLSMMFFFFYNLFIFCLFPLIEWNKKQLNFFLIFHLSGLPLSLMFLMKIFILIFLFKFNMFFLFCVFMFSISIIFNYFKIVEYGFLYSKTFLIFNNFWNFFPFIMIYNLMILFLLL